MKQKVISHKHLHAMVLCIILAFSIVMFSFLQGKKDLQFIVGFISALSYVMWGIIYHMIEKDLYLKVVIEYLLIGTVGLVLLYTVLSV